MFQDPPKCLMIVMENKRALGPAWLNISWKPTSDHLFYFCRHYFDIIFRCIVFFIEQNILFTLYFFSMISDDMREIDLILTSASWITEVMKLHITGNIMRQNSSFKMILFLDLICLCGDKEEGAPFFWFSQVCKQSFHLLFWYS